MDAAANDLDLQVVVGKEFTPRPDVLERATQMLKAALVTANVVGQWRCMVLGKSAPGALMNPSQYWMEVQSASAMLPNMVNLSVRSSLMGDGAILGMIRVPTSLVVADALKSIKLAIASLNQSGWQGIVEREERESMKPTGNVVVDRGGPPRSSRTVGGVDDKPQRSDGALNNRIAQRLIQERSGRVPPSRPEPVASAPIPSVVAKAEPVVVKEPLTTPCSQDSQRVHGQWTVTTRVTPKPTVAGHDGGARIQGVERTLPSSTPLSNPSSSVTTKEAIVPKARQLDDAAKLQEFVKRALSGSTDGLVYSNRTMLLVREVFPDYHATTGPLFKTLVGRGYLDFLSHGQYRVTQAFVREHGLGIVLDPLPSGETTGDHKGPENPKPAAAVGTNGASKPDRKKKRGPPRLGADALVQAIKDNQQTWNELEADVRAAEARVAVAQAELEAARRRFEAHNEGLRAALGVFGRGGTGLATLLAGPMPTQQ